MKNINLEPKLVGDIEGYFYIPAYQRGYRWKDEVALMLNDINEVPEGQNYSLQPIVVKKLSDNKFELIDGQQRLTTIYLILKYIQNFLPLNEINFSIYYETRVNSKTFLESINFANLDIPIENIDEYFFVEAARTIVNWFENQDNKSQAAVDISTMLNRNIRFIWYEVDSDADSVSLFTRLNIGRIPLRNSELVKALFLSRNSGVDETKQIEISTQWDDIEKELQNDNLWYFITNKSPKAYPTRIELIFDLMADKKKDEREKFFTFFHFDQKIKNTNKKPKIWTEILRYYQKLKEWHENVALYHKVGYLIASDSKSMATLIKSSEKVAKTTFQKSLDEFIAESINFKKEYSELTYNSDDSSIEKLLLLFNVETIRQKSETSMRFPFDKHKTENWSIEHIHAQQSEGLNTNTQWSEWLSLHKMSLINIDKDENYELIEEIREVLKERVTREQFSDLYDKVIKALSCDDSIEYTHQLSNLALLSQWSNSALSNSTFDVKRNKILEMDRDSDYIPECTRRIFLKYYTPSQSNQLHFWGKADRDGYIAAINRVLENYLILNDKEIKI